MEAAQCFPLYLYEERSEENSNFTAALLGGRTLGDGAKYRRKSAISTAALHRFREHFADPTIDAEALFYYIYGVLHAPDYRKKYADNFTKELPRIPFAKSLKDFWEFVAAGRDLGGLHVHYESQPEFKVGDHRRKWPARPHGTVPRRPDALYRESKRVVRKAFAITTISRSRGFRPRPMTILSMASPAIEWVMERQARRVDKDTGIVNDANDYAVQTMGDPRYPLSLLLRVITVALETQRIVRKLPGLV